MNFLLYCDNPNYTKNSFLIDCCNLNIESITNFSDDFEKLCLQVQKNKMDFTVGEIIKFIKKSTIYKKLEQELSLKFSRAIILSKFTNETSTQHLINSLTIDELNRLTS
jgi:hypothetical protein